MKLIKQTVLSFRRGRSDKVYEVDLCEVGPDRYVVNFRYGRRGSNLKEGSKTPFPVALAEAEREFDKLVASKTKKGYQEGSAAATPEPAERPARTSAPAPGGLGPREQAILERLRLGQRAPRGARKLERAVWRAGELGLNEAEPLLFDLLRESDRGQTMLRYCLVWALGRLGSRDAIAHVERIADDAKEPEKVRRIAVEARRRLYGEHDNPALEKFVAAQIDSLPKPLAELARTGPSERFAEELWRLMQAGGKKSFQAFAHSYLIDNENVRPALLTLLARVPFEQRYFIRVRHLFKAAEFRRDGEVFGAIAYRFEKNRPRYTSWWSRRNKDQPFYTTTKRYMRRRVWRTLRRMGQDGSPEFVRMAVGVLLPFTDDDAGRAQRRTYYRWRAPDIVLQWDQYASFWAFNHLLYGNSNRYYPDRGGRAFRCREGYKPGGKPPKRREESFPRLWEKTPQGLLHLLDESRCQRVHEFAAKALLECSDFLAQLDASVAAMLLSRPYDVTVQAGFELAKRLYDGQLDDDERAELIAAVIDCQVDEARRLARSWFDTLRAQRPTLSDRANQILATLATSAYPDNREYARITLRTTFFSDDVARVFIGRMTAVIKSMGDDENERIADIAQTLLTCFSRQLADVGLDVIRDFMAHPAAAAQEFAAGLLLNHSELARKVPDRILYALLDSPHEGVRRVGTQLLSQLSDHAIVERKELLFLLSTHEHADLRTSIRPVIQRLAGSRADLAGYLVESFVDALMHKHERGVHSHLLTVLAQDLRAHLARIPKDQVWTLLHHKHPHAQELGGILLAENVGPDELSILEIVRLASHEILSVREGSWRLCERAIERLKQAMPTAIRLLDARWDDSREFAFGFFRERFSRTELSPPILVAICDSVRPDVQRFGRELITRYFEDADGHTYLSQLAEHPSESLQLFASNYLERYAAGNVERMEELEPYFISVLSRINKGRIAKQRVVAFLHQQALADRDIAEIAARIFARQSATIAVGQREAMIKAMVDIGRAHPDIEQPIAVRAVPVRASQRLDASEEASGGV